MLWDVGAGSGSVAIEWMLASIRPAAPTRSSGIPVGRRGSPAMPPRWACQTSPSSRPKRRRHLAAGLPSRRDLRRRRRHRARRDRRLHRTALRAGRPAGHQCRDDRDPGNWLLARCLQGAGRRCSDHRLSIAVRPIAVGAFSWLAPRHAGDPSGSGQNHERPVGRASGDRDRLPEGVCTAESHRGRWFEKPGAGCTVAQGSAGACRDAVRPSRTSGIEPAPAGRRRAPAARPSPSCPVSKRCSA